MPEVVRLRNYRDYGQDGKSWTEMKAKSKDEVLVAIILGCEPKVITDESQYFDVDEAILEVAEVIKKARAARDAKK